MRRETRILHILPRFFDDIDVLRKLERVGGAERYVVNLCRAQRELGHDSALMLFAEKENNLEVDGVHILTARAKRCIHGINGDFNPLPTDLQRFASALNMWEIVHVHNFAGDVSVLASFIRKFMRKNYRLIATDHNWNGLTIARVFKTSKPMMKFSGFDGLLPVTRAASSFYMNFAKVFRPLYGGVDPERFRPVNGKRGKDILFVGRLTPYKKVENIIKAISLLEDQPRLTVIGPTLDKQYRTLLEELASKLNVDTRFLGTVSDESLVKYLSSSAALVLPSIDEGFGLVLLEAMACELPVVANRAGGVPEAVDDGETGYLVRQGDIQQLSDRMRLLLTDEREAIRLGIAGRRRVLEKFTWRHVAERSIEAYEEVLL